MTKSPMAWINGKVQTAENAKVSVFDRGFLFGDGIYETGRSYQKTFVFLEEHWMRLRSSAEKLGIKITWTNADLEQGLYELAQAFGQPDVYFRTIVTRGAIESVGIDVFGTQPPTLVHIIQPISEEKLHKLRQSGIHVLTSHVVRNASDAQDPNIKTSNYLNSLLALQDVKRRGADDAILCNRLGQVTEGTTFSVFGVTEEGKLITPAQGVGILDSITRRHVLEEARRFMATEEGEFPVETFMNCREAFIASSVREIVPIHTWDGKKFTEVPGPVTRDLQARLRAVIDTYVRSHRKF